MERKHCCVRGQGTGCEVSVRSGREAQWEFAFEEILRNLAFLRDYGSRSELLTFQEMLDLDCMTLRLERSPDVIRLNGKAG